MRTDSPDIYAANELQDWLFGVASNAKIASDFLEIGDLAGCAYAVRRMHAYHNAVINALKLIRDTRAASAQTIDGADEGTNPR
jgi:hypothetical protein